VEHRARYDAGSPLDRPAPTDMVESIMRIREDLGLCRFNGSKMSLRQGQAEMVKLTQVKHLKSLMFRRPTA
jgi:hypothetical protein